MVVPTPTPVPTHRRVLSLETEWLRGWATVYLPIDGSLTIAPAGLRSARVNLVDLKNLCSYGVVTWADKLDEPGALWRIEGPDCDGEPLVAMVVVQTQEYDVCLRSVERTEPKKDEPNEAA